VHVIQFAALAAAIFEILDVVALAEADNFDIIGGFKSTWRAHAWEGDHIHCYFGHRFLLIASMTHK